MWPGVLLRAIRLSDHVPRAPLSDARVEVDGYLRELARPDGDGGGLRRWVACGVEIARTQHVRPWRQRDAQGYQLCAQLLGCGMAIY